MNPWRPIFDSRIVHLGMEAAKAPGIRYPDKHCEIPRPQGRDVSHRTRATSWFKLQLGNSGISVLSDTAAFVRTNSAQVP
jgi:hypothetical protein